MKRPPALRRILYFLGLVVALPLFGRQIWLTYQSLTSGEMQLLHPPYLLLAVAGTLLMSFMQAIGWVWLMRYLGERLSLKQCLAGYFASFLPRYIPGSVWGYVSRGAWLEQRYGIGYAASSLGSFLEVGLFVTTTGLISALALAVLHPEFALVLLLAVGVVLVAVRILLPPAIQLYARRFLKHDATPHPYNHRWAYAILVLYIAFWLIYGGVVWAGAAAFGYSPPLLSTAMAAAQSWLVGLLVVIVPAGLGVRETTLAGLLAGQGMPSGAAASTAVISRLALLLAEVIWLLIGMLFARGQRFEVKNEQYTAGNPANNPDGLLH